MKQLVTSLCIFFCFFCFLSGCQIYQAKPNVAATNHAVSLESENNQALKKALLDYNKILHLPTESAHREYEQLSQNLNQQSCSNNKIRLGMLLTHPSIQLPVDKNIVEVLQPCLNNPDLNNTSFYTLLKIIDIQIKEKAKQEQHKQSLTQKIKALRGQVDALKAIEKSIHERDTPADEGIKNDE